MWLDPQHFKTIENHLGFYNWENKRILDIGADWGSTALYFLRHRNAKQVIAIEGDPIVFSNLDANIKYYLDSLNITIPEERWDKAVVERLWIDSSEKFAYLLCKYDFVDVVKIDIEGSEIFLYFLPDEIIAVPKEYVIEVHSESIRELLKNKLEKNFKVDVVTPTVIVAVNYQPVGRVHI